MKVIEVPIDQVKPYENNPRDNDSAVEITASSIKEFGFQQPIVVDKDNVIIVGHTRLRAAISLGLKKVPIVIADKLSNEQVSAYRIADNKASDYAIWDNKKLLDELEALEKSAVYTGFDTSEYFEDVLDEQDNEPIENNNEGVTMSLTFSTQNEQTFEKVKQFIEEVAMLE